MNLNAREFPCPSCEGEKAYRARSEWARKSPARSSCRFCAMTGSVTIDPEAIREALLVSRGRSKGTFRRSRPALPGDRGGVYGAAWVWRMLRFDTGADMCLPVMAGDYVGTGWIVREADRAVTDHLHAVESVLGVSLFGSARMARGAARWGQALGLEGADELSAVVEATVGMPSGNGYAVGGADESPEAALEEVTDLDGNVDYDALGDLLSAGSGGEG